MSRVIEFRALKDDISNCKYVYGQLVYDANGIPRITEVYSSGQGLTFHTCLKGTEGQFTGLLDVNGRRIYEGDYDKDGNVVVWCETCHGWQFALCDFETKGILNCHNCEGNFMFLDNIQDCVITGSIH